MASYLTTIYIDDFTVVEGELADGKPVVSAIAADANPDATSLARSTARVVDLLSTYFGPYPFQAAGGIFTGLDIGFALETATRPTYGGGRIASFETVVHELAHQWYGDDVTVAALVGHLPERVLRVVRTLAVGRRGGERRISSDLWKQQMANVADQPDFWRSPLVDMGPGEEFTRVYDRGPLALHALRNEIGDDAFLTLLKQWPATYGGKNATLRGPRDDGELAWPAATSRRSWTPGSAGRRCPTRSSGTRATWAAEASAARSAAPRGTPAPGPARPAPGSSSPGRGS